METHADRYQADDRKYFVDSIVHNVLEVSDGLYLITRKVDYGRTKI